MASDPRRHDDSPRTLRLRIEYDGTAYGGWQRQANAPSIQELLEAVLHKMTGEEVFVRGASRTDAGVHALGQTASFVTRSTISTRGFFRGLNTMLPRDIAIRACDEAAPGFDARLFSEGKRYRYRILNRRAPSALRHRFVWHLPWPTLALAPMQAAAAHLEGRHDFAAFRAADCERTGTVREMRRVAVTERDDEIHIDVEGTAFLKYMVRVFVGTLVGVGRGQLTPDDVVTIRDAGDRRRAGMTAPAHGLCLLEVCYDDPPKRHASASRRLTEAEGGKASVESRDDPRGKNES